MQGGEKVVETKLATLEVKEKTAEKELEELKNDFKDFQKEVHEEIAKIKEQNELLTRLVMSVEQLEKNLGDTNKQIGELSVSQTEIKEKITVLEQQPAQKALEFTESIKKKVIMGIVIGAIGFILGALIPFPVPL